VVGVYPSLILTYLGQASWLMHNLDGYSAVFYNSLPRPVFWPIFVVSVLASIVASQVTELPGHASWCLQQHQRDSHSA
jgi:KUP system potassium uptake protein